MARSGSEKGNPKGNPKRCEPAIRYGSFEFPNAADDEKRPRLIEIRPERSDDADAIRAVTRAAFAGAAHSSGTEAAIIDALRAAGVLTVSLVALQNGAIVGHVAFSPVTIDGQAGAWFGLGPVSVQPDRQRAGVGQALIRQGLDRLKHLNAEGCVVLGDPAYYGRFGFKSDPALRYADVPPEYFQWLAFAGAMSAGAMSAGAMSASAMPRGEVAYHPGFAAT